MGLWFTICNAKIIHFFHAQCTLSRSPIPLRMPEKDGYAPKGATMKTQSFIPLILSGVIGIACNQSTEESNAADEVEIQESDYDKDESDYDKDESDYDKDESEQEDDAGYEKDEDGE